MTLQMHPIALGCMLVVAVGTLIYTYMTTKPQSQQHGYGRDRDTYDIFDEPVSGASSWTSMGEGSGHSSRRKKNTDNCSICLGTQKSSMKTLTCNHSFHAHCISVWLNSHTTCPICRREAHI